MSLFYFLMGVMGLLLAGASFSKGLMLKNYKIYGLGVIELIIGLYFIVSLIGKTQ